MVAADVYAVAPHTGRGGWTWYTGSAGWLYRLILESLLGLRLTADPQSSWLHFEPCLPDDWRGFQLQYRFRTTLYRIAVRRASVAGARAQVSVDGIAQTGPAIALVDDGREHAVEVTLQGLSSARLGQVGG